METFFSQLKTEGLYPCDIRLLEEAQSRIIETYIPGAMKSHRDFFCEYLRKPYMGIC
jgi:hypothetical protein